MEDSAQRVKDYAKRLKEGAGSKDWNREGIRGERRWGKYLFWAHMYECKDGGMVALKKMVLCLK